jgi:hypothetical protein
MIGGEMTRFDEFTSKLLKNRELLEILKDSHSAHQLFRRGGAGQEQIAWITTHVRSGYYIALFNAGEETGDITLEMDSIGLQGDVEAYDIWEQKEIGIVGDTLTARVNPHGAAVFRINRV